MNKGYGAALKTGVPHAKGETVIMMDSDGQHDPQYIGEIENALRSMIWSSGNEGGPPSR